MGARVKSGPKEVLGSGHKGRAIRLMEPVPRRRFQEVPLPLAQSEGQQGGAAHVVDGIFEDHLLRKHSARLLGDDLVRWNEDHRLEPAFGLDRAADKRAAVPRHDLEAAEERGRDVVGVPLDLGAGLEDLLRRQGRALQSIGRPETADDSGGARSKPAAQRDSVDAAHTQGRRGHARPLVERGGGAVHKVALVVGNTARPLAVSLNGGCRVPAQADGQMHVQRGPHAIESRAEIRRRSGHARVRAVEIHGENDLETTARFRIIARNLDE